MLYETIAQGQIAVEDLIARDWTRVSELINTYSDIGLDAADASIAAMAERLGQHVIATLDERDFRIIKPNHTDAFQLVPGPG